MCYPGPLYLICHKRHCNTIVKIQKYKRCELYPQGKACFDKEEYIIREKSDRYCQVCGRAKAAKAAKLKKKDERNQDDSSSCQSSIMSKKSG